MQHKLVGSVKWPYWKAASVRPLLRTEPWQEHFGPLEHTQLRIKSPKRSNGGLWPALVRSRVGSGSDSLLFPHLHKPEPRFGTTPMSVSLRIFDRRNPELWSWLWKSGGARSAMPLI